MSLLKLLHQDACLASTSQQLTTPLNIILRAFLFPLISEKKRHSFSARTPKINGKFHKSREKTIT